MPRDMVPGRLSHLNLLRNPPVQGSQEADMLNLPRDPILRGLTCLELPRDAWLSGCNILGRINFRKSHP